MIKVEGLVKRYFSVTALDDFSLDILAGESVGLLGANGAGKSTLINILIGLLKFQEGQVSVLRTAPRAFLPEHKSQIGFVAETPSLLPFASGRETAALFSSLYPRWSQPLFEKCIEEWGVTADKKVKALSKGQKRLMELALCFSTQPRLLILDEPFSGLDAVMRFKIRNFLRDINASAGVTILYSSHILHEVETFSKRVVIIRKGKKCLDKSLKQLNEPLENVFAGIYELSPQTSE